MARRTGAVSPKSLCRRNRPVLCPGRRPHASLTERRRVIGQVAPLVLGGLPPEDTVAVGEAAESLDDGPMLVRVVCVLGEAGAPDAVRLRRERLETARPIGAGDRGPPHAGGACTGTDARPDAGRGPARSRCRRGSGAAAWGSCMNAAGEPRWMLRGIWSSRITRARRPCGVSAHSSRTPRAASSSIAANRVVHSRSKAGAVRNQTVLRRCSASGLSAASWNQNDSTSVGVATVTNRCSSPWPYHITRPCRSSRQIADMDETVIRAMARVAEHAGGPGMAVAGPKGRLEAQGRADTESRRGPVHRPQLHIGWPGPMVLPERTAAGVRRPRLHPLGVLPRRARRTRHPHRPRLRCRRGRVDRRDRHVDPPRRARSRHRRRS